MDIKANTIGQLEKTGSVAVATYSLVKYIIFLAVFSLFFIILMFFGLPFYIGIIFILFAVLLLILQIIRIKRIASANLGPETNSVKNSKPIAGEKLIAQIPGIMSAGTYGAGYSFLGTGKRFHAENAMIITNKRILFIVVPVAGAGKMIGDVDTSTFQWLLAAKNIGEKLNSMLKSMSLQKILNSDARNFAINQDEIKKIKISFLGNLTFVLTNGKRLKYGIRQKEDREKARELFRDYM